jgi:hypothetical protein
MNAVFLPAGIDGRWDGNMLANSPPLPRIVNQRARGAAIRLLAATAAPCPARHTSIVSNTRREK